MTAIAFESKTGQKRARLATLTQLSENLLPSFLDPVPCRATLRAWFDAAKIPRLKTGLNAKRGGGEIFYSVPHVEKFFTSRTVPPKEGAVQRA